MRSEIVRERRAWSNFLTGRRGKFLSYLEESNGKSRSLGRTLSGRLRREIGLTIAEWMKTASAKKQRGERRRLRYAHIRLQSI